jgi:hypothetical protein
MENQEFSAGFSTNRPVDNLRRLNRSAAARPIPSRRRGKISGAAQDAHPDAVGHASTHSATELEKGEIGQFGVQGRFLICYNLPQDHTCHHTEAELLTSR